MRRRPQHPRPAGIRRRAIPTRNPDIAINPRRQMIPLFRLGRRHQNHRLPQMPLHLIQKRRQLAINRSLTRRIRTPLWIDRNRNRRRQHPLVPRHSRHEIARLRIRRRTQIINMHRPNLQPNRPRRIIARRKRRIPLIRPRTRRQIHKIRALPPRPIRLHRPPLNRAIARIQPQPLDRISGTIRHPVNSPTPPTKHRNRQHQSQCRDQQPAVHPCLSQNTKFPKRNTNHPLICRTHINVNSRRAVTKSVAILPSSFSSNIVAASL